MTKDNQKQIALWKLEYGYAESDSSNSITREELLILLEPKKKEFELRLLREYFEVFGEDYIGDIIEDVVMNKKTHQELEKLANQI